MLNIIRIFYLLKLSEHLKLVTKVDDNGVFHGWNIDPLTIFEELEAADFVILEEQDEATSISMGPESHDQIGFGTWWVVADFGAKVW